ncbi:MAG: AMP-binding protein [Gammaproteobacteria bacterium]|nr:AMP-binding protein [Gammaproteobacteria bacterium]
MSANLFARFEQRARAEPARPLLSTDGERWFTWGDLATHSGRLATLFTVLGLVPGDRLAMIVDKSAQALFLYLACLRAGLVCVPLNVGYTRSELGYFLGNATPRVIVCSGAALADMTALAGASGCDARVLSLDADGSGSLYERAGSQAADFDTVARQDGDVAALIYTSGTTGQPKGVMVTHGNLASNGLTLVAQWGMCAGDVLVHALPLFHVHGLFVACHCVLLSGARMYFLPRFEPRSILSLLPRATVLMGVPTFYTRLLAEPALNQALCRNMRLFVSGSAPLLEETFAAFRARTGHTILERYGMSETGMNTSNPLTGPRKPGTVGPPLPGVSVRIVDDAGRPVPAGTVGAIQVRGPNVFAGYWGMPDKSAADLTVDGYLRTGDLGVFDADGYLAIVGRARDLVISGGYNVYPKEVEAVLDRIPGVRESAVFGVPHPDFGEAVTAAVVCTASAEPPTAQDLIRAAREHLAAYKLPKRVVFVDELPRNSMGKVQKALLRERYATPDPDFG